AVRRRRVGRLPRRWRPADALHVGGTVLRLRTDAPAGRTPRPAPSPWLWSALASAVAGVALAVALRQPLLLVGAAVGLAGLLATRAPAAARTDGRAPGPADDPAGTAPAPADVAAVRARAARATRTGEVLGTCAPGASLPVGDVVRHGGGWSADGGVWSADGGVWPTDGTAGSRDRTGGSGGGTAGRAGGTLALVGAREHTLAAARALVLRALATGPDTDLVLRSASPGDWTWTRWLAPTTDLPPPGARDHAGPCVVVADGPDPALGTWRAAAPASHGLLLVVPPGAHPPAWVRTVVRVDGARAVRTEADGGRAAGPAELVGVAVADDAARRLAAARWTARGAVHARPLPGPRTAGTAGARPAHLPGAASGPWPAPTVLGALAGVPAADAPDVARRWRAADARAPLRAPLGTAADGSEVALDLDADGPHVLVAGTTGAGKSELLTTLVLGLALQHPPHRLALLLADFKGGTGLGPLAGLPHVVDHVDDLDAGAARRTLTGLRAELRRRERTLAAAGAADVRRLDPDAPGTPPRLLVVVDELRALVDDVPEAVDVLARIAAQGRALGVHLVLATQRPAGVVTADLRANVTQRVALRVADDADSRDVVDVPDAAHLDPAHPGRGLVRVGSRAPLAVQVARARPRRSGPPVRLAAAHAPPAAPWRPRVGPGADDVAAWVSAARRAARGRPGPGVPWCPPLPSRVTTADVPPGDGLALALADVPDEQRRAGVRWEPASGPLLVLGGPASGRSSTLLTVAAGATRAGAHVHTVGLPEAAVRAVSDPRTLGTVLPPDEAHRTGLLLDRLHAAAGTGPPAVLVVDRLDVLLETLGRHARGAAADLLVATWRDPAPGLSLAASAAVVPAVARLLGDFPTRLVLPVVDASADALAGVPAHLSAARTTPGRAVLTGAGPARVCQVVQPPADRDVDDAPPGEGTAPGAPVRVARLPDHVPPPAPTRTADGTVVVPLGVGGDDGGPVHADATRPLVVAGPPGSGRTTALLAVARAWAAAGHRVLRLAPAGAHGDDGEDVPWTTVGPGVPPTPPDGDASTVLVVDDVDELERTAPAAADAVDDLLHTPRPRVVALATTSAHAAGAFRGPVATALRSRLVVVLDPHDADATALLGAGAALQGDPARRVPGRGVLRRDRTLRRVQVHAAGPPDRSTGGRTAGPMDGPADGRGDGDGRVP
ncbi:FtsK/SpoIIIE domain-containing protein, partial [Cellulomonas sp. NPDC057328]|uniref:FtsK/SpoIIIE domain-containing protein n=1 Tax=Cellulomonas sp. NPDC057328 TaxID=3346101 RepID=UPI0036429A77